MRSMATKSSSAAEANRLPKVVAWAATLWERPAMTRVSYSAARSVIRRATVMALVRMSSRDRYT